MQLQQQSQTAKFSHEATCFRFKSYMGPRLLNGSLMQNTEITSHTFSCFIFWARHGY